MLYNNSTITIFSFTVGLFSSLLRLLASHFPHLALVEDWLEDDDVTLTAMPSKNLVSEGSLIDGEFEVVRILPFDLPLPETSFLPTALQTMSICPSQASRMLNALLTMPTKQMWPYVHIFVRHLRSTLDESVPVYIQGK